jgi:hypothetical protein
MPRVALQQPEESWVEFGYSGDFALATPRTLSCFTACSNIRRHFVRTKYKIFVAGDDQTVCDVFFALETMSKFRIHVRCLCVESSL